MIDRRFDRFPSMKRLMAWRTTLHVTLPLDQAARRYEKLRQAAANSPRRRALLEERARFVAESLRRWYGHQASEPEAWALFARYFTSPFAMTLEERDRAEALGTQLLLARSSSRGGA